MILIVVCVLAGVYGFTWLVGRAGLSHQSAVSTNVHWMGHPMFFEGDSKAGSFHWADDIELGCREDGTVIWKRVPFDTNAPQIKIPHNFLQ